MQLHFESFEKNYIANILLEMYIQKVYEPILRDRSGLTILDLGANIGLFSMYAAKYASKILAVEPSSQIYQYLLKNIETNGLKDKVIPVQAAVGSENGKLELFGSDVNLTMFSAHKTGVHGEKTETVKQLGLLTLLNLHSIEHVDFMKLDIEGSEFELLASDEFAKAASKIDFIMGEIHSWTGRNPQQCVQAMEECGFDVTIVSQSPLLFEAKRK